MRVKIYKYKCTCGNHQQLANQFSLPLFCSVCLKTICLKCGPIGYCQNCEIYLKEEEFIKLNELNKKTTLSIPPIFIFCFILCVLPMSLLLFIGGILDEMVVIWIIGFCGIIASIFIIILYKKKSKRKLNTYLQYHSEVTKKIKERVEDPETFFKENKGHSRISKYENTKICQECNKANPKEMEFCFRCGSKFD